jgi:RNA polymerase sigma-70 factor (ECF subfamily)
LSQPIAADARAAEASVETAVEAAAEEGRVMPSLEEAFARWQDELLGTLYYLVGNREDARDALQETFVKCWRHCKRYAEGGGEGETGRQGDKETWRQGKEGAAEVNEGSRNWLDEVENLKAWIFRVALNTGRDVRASAWRRRRQSLVDEGTMLTAVERNPASDVERAEELGRVRRALRDLRPEEQEVFLLRQNGALTYEAIAEAIGIPLGTVKTRMRLAIEKLRVALA